MQLFDLKSISRSGNKRQDGSYEVFKRDLGIFDSVEKAEQFMYWIIDKEGEYSDFHCFVIFEKTLNGELSKKWDAVYEFQSVRSYLPDGTLYCDSPYDDGCEKPFCGRPEDIVKLKVGDLVWFWRGNRISPGLVAGLPFTDTFYRKKVEESGHEMGLDYTDDSYKVYTCENGHEHPECWRCMPYYGKISKRNLQRLYACKKHEEVESERWRKKQKAPFQTTVDFSEKPESPRAV